MKKFVSMILSALLAPQVLFAGPLAISLSNMKPVVRSGEAQSSALVPVAYKEIPGPGRVLPENPPHLTNGHYKQFMDGMIDIEEDALARWAQSQGLVLETPERRQAFHKLMSEKEQVLQNAAKINPEALSRFAESHGLILKPEEKEVFAGIMRAPGVENKVFRDYEQALWGQVMGDIDIHSVDEVTPEKWNRIISKMHETARKIDLGEKGKSWDKTTTDVFRTAVNELGQAHSSYLSVNEFRAMQEMTRGSFAGMGIRIKPQKEGIGVVSIFEKSGALDAGLKRGDVIVDIRRERDGAPLWTAENPTATEPIPLLTGKPGSFVYVNIMREGEENKVYRVMRTKVKRPNMFAKMIPGTAVGYLHFVSWNETTEKDMIREIDALKAAGMQALIFDVRKNPGGLLSQAADVTSEFLRNEQDIVLVKRQGKLVTRFTTDGDGVYHGLPLAVLVDGGSASASEIFAAAMKDHKRAVVVGSHSFGKGSVQTIMPEPGGMFRDSSAGALRLTTQNFYSPDGRKMRAERNPDGSKVEGTGGVEPDVSVPLTEEQAAAIKDYIDAQLFGDPAPEVQDPVVDKAVEILTQEPV